MIVRRMHYELVDIIARVRREKAWRPTPAQEQTASRLADSDGGWVRTRGDGATELRTIERGESRRYVIHKDGKAELIESGLAPPRFVWSGRLQAAGMLWFLGAVGLLGLGDKYDWGLLVAVSVIAAFTGLAIFVAGVSIWGQAINRVAPPPGERWETIGGQDF